MVKDRYKDVDRPRVKVEIAAVDPTEEKTYEAGCHFLRKWYHEKFLNYSATRPDN